MTKFTRCISGLLPSLNVVNRVNCKLHGVYQVYCQVYMVYTRFIAKFTDCISGLLPRLDTVYQIYC